MKETEIERHFKAFMTEQRNRPFGEAHLAPTRELAPFSRASHQAATNLLVKAERALTDGDVERAQRLIDRVVALPLDEHEQVKPAAWSVHMMLFDDVIDALEASPQGDSRWLEAALAALPSAEGWGGSELRRALLVVRDDYEVEVREVRAINAAVADLPERESLLDADLSPAELAVAVGSVLGTVRAYRSALAGVGAG